MKLTYFPDKECPNESPAVLGGKGASLCRLIKSGFSVPRTACLSTRAYQYFLDENGLREKILMELNRKNFSDMRWEEIWDASLRIRNHFLTGKIPEEISEAVAYLDREFFENAPVAVRSSASEEDAPGTSFAGLHESFLNIRGTTAILAHVVKVWASLWSDRALLYRRELGLDIYSSSMAVIIQELFIGESSGIAFSQDPADSSRLVIEAVHGLNEGLVDGEIEPDRWLLSKSEGTVLAHNPPPGRDRQTTVKTQGTGFADIPDQLRQTAPLNQSRQKLVYRAALELEKLFGRPQDVEWSIKGEKLFILQSRPITTITKEGKKDERSWYLSLHRSFDNLAQLQKNIEQELIPRMIEEAAELSRVDLAPLSDPELADEIEKRETIKEKWRGIYWSEFIPFAHGMRIFGEIYNDLIKPEDPHEFVFLLSEEELLSVRRNEMLNQLGTEVNRDPVLKKALEEKKFSEIINSNFLSLLENFERQFTAPFSFYLSEDTDAGLLENLAPVILQYTLLPGIEHPVKDIRIELEKTFLAAFDKSPLPFSGPEVLALARAGYRLRDDDNIHLGRIENELSRAVNEGKMRLLLAGKAGIRDLPPLDTAELLRNPGFFKKKLEKKERVEEPENPRKINARQIMGQPASKGIARGQCRVIGKDTDLTEFKQGEILIVDAIDPNMTFIAPLAAAIVERRGGMLIHGAIIAREYGIPCVTGVPDIMEFTQTGDTVTVDGYLGIVTLGK